MTKEEAKNKIQLLIDKFSSQKDYYKSTNYNETQTRQDFINPFFTALGWDLDNTKEQLETYRDVRHEDKIKVNGHTKAPDYSFNINGKRKFFVEAKKPSVSIRENPMPALQVRNYAWNGGLSVSILTDFEELAIYDCTRKPRNVENANAKRLKYIYYTDYIKEFDFIWDTFNFDNVTNGSIEKYAKSKINFKNAEPVDKEFLKTLEKWREDIAVSIALNNKQLDEEELNFTVQQTIDRIVFLKVCEDRKIEKENNLLKTIKSGNYYQNLYTYFQIADQKYNSGLFDFKKDTITKNIVIENRIIKRIITKLYGKNKEEETDFGFNFAIIPVEILGFAYEQFLGKVIKLNPAHRAEIEEKPEVRKAGGVYYTPEYIVEYIVKQTVGELIDNKTPDEISKIKILDPSCGSGSFLLGAYQYLLDYHLKYYNQLRIKNYELRNSKKKLELLLTPEGNLSSQEKKRILLNNIFGVDIDAQAVEVTKLSLLLKALEGETDASIQTSLQIFNERVLPTLDDNIQCGNSLIAPDFYNDGLFLTPKEERKINVFDWNEGFPEVFKQGGFDCVIGNPPYVNIENLEEHSKKYYFQKYKTCKGRTDIYIAFIENNLNNLNKNGLLYFIIPFAFTNQNYGSKLREILIKNYFIKEIVDTSEFYIFDQAVVKNIILGIQNLPNQNETKILVVKDKDSFINKNFATSIVNQTSFLKLKDFRLETKTISNLISIKDKIWGNSIPLSNLCLVAYGARLNHKTKKIGKDNYISLEYKKDFKPFLEGKNIDRYSYTQYGWLNYQPNEHYNSMFPELFENEKIMFIRIIKDKLRFVYDNQGFYNSHTVINCIKIDKLQNASHISAKKILKNVDFETCKNYNNKYLLGILNSNLINWYFNKFLSDNLNFYPNDAKSLPIKTIDFKNKTEKQQHDNLSKLVETMLELNKRLQGAKLQTEKDQLKRRIDFTDKEIDKLVYKLYNLTEEDIDIIEGKNA